MLCCSRKSFKTYSADNLYYFNQVSAVTDQGGVQLGTTTGDLDDDEGGGLVGFLFPHYKLYYCGFSCLFLFSSLFVLLQKVGLYMRLV